MNCHIINATPHDVYIDRSVLDGQVFVSTKAPTSDPLEAQLQTTENGSLVYAIPASGFRLAADPVITGPTYDCDISYRAGNEAELELQVIRSIMYQLQGVEAIVIASEISCRTVLGSFPSLVNDGVLGIKIFWPVLAPESLRLPMPKRWASALATVHTPCHNECGEEVGSQPYWSA